MKQDVQFDESDLDFIIRFIDNETYALEREIEPADKPVKIGLTKTGELHIREIHFPKTIYSEQNVRGTADTIRSRFEQEGCKSCIALHEVDNTRPTFLVPTLKELVGDFIDTFPQ